MRVAILFMHEELSPKAYLRAARCFEALDKSGQAARTYRELLETFPDSAESAEARARLAEAGASDAGVPEAASP
jgi:TolA-binding protein